MTATPFCILPVTGRMFQDRFRVMDRSRERCKQWSQNVGVDIEQQIKTYSAECGICNRPMPTPYQFRKK